MLSCPLHRGASSGPGGGGSRLRHKIVLLPAAWTASSLPLVRAESSSLDTSSKNCCKQLQAEFRAKQCTKNLENGTKVFFVCSALLEIALRKRDPSLRLLQCGHLTAMLQPSESFLQLYSSSGPSVPACQHGRTGTALPSQQHVGSSDVLCEQSGYRNLPSCHTWLLHLHPKSPGLSDH